MWKSGRVVAVAGWCFGLVAGLLLGTTAGRVVLLILLIVHPLELPVGLVLAHRRSYPMGSAALRTLIFGSLFWIPELLLANDRYAK